jgi:hypothetical protein
VLAGLALVGFAHTDQGRSLLAWLPGGCPANLGAADPLATEAFRIQRLRARAPNRVAKSTPGWYFTLGSSSKPEVQAWSRKHRASCEPSRGGFVLACSLPCNDSDSTVDHAHFQFDEQMRLVAVDLFNRGAPADNAIAHIRARQAQLTAAVGPVTRHVGELNESQLTRHRLAHAGIEYRYRSYLAKLSVTNRGKNVVVREQYQWTPIPES